MAAPNLVYSGASFDESTLRSNIEADMKGLLEGDPSALIHIVDLNMSLCGRINELEANYKSSLDSLQVSEERIGFLMREIDTLKHDNGQLISKLALVDDSTRSSNLRIEGLLEAENENIKESIASCLSRSGIMCQVEDIDYAKRMGRYREGQNRPVMVRLLKEGLRNAILYNRSNVSKNSNPPVWVNDDVSETTRKQRKRVRDVAYLANLKGVGDVKIHSDGIVIGKDKYHHADLDLLPPVLSTQSATTRVDDEDIFFQGTQSPFSNFHPSPIENGEGLIFFNAEQMFHHRRAISHGKTTIANKILKTRDPVEVKKLSKKFQSSTEWRTAEEDIMADILLLKFTQNKELGRALLNTGDRQLHEATGDRKWAVGYDISSKGLTQNEWRGGDLLGQLLENTREAIKTNYGPISPRPLLSNPAHSLSLEDPSTIPISDDEAEDEASDYEECLQPDGILEHMDGGQTPLSNLDIPAPLSGTPSKHTSRSAEQSNINQSDSNNMHRLTGSPTSTYSKSDDVSPALTVRKKPRNPFRSFSQTTVKTRFSTSDVLDQQFNISSQPPSVVNQQFGSSRRQSLLPSDKRHTRSKNKSRLQAK